MKEQVGPEETGASLNDSKENMVEKSGKSNIR